MTIPPEHQNYLRRKDYTPRRADAFSVEETAVLSAYGHWMEALAAGRIAPATPEQTHFLQVARGEAEPETLFERVWRKVCDSQAGPASTPPLADGHRADPPAELPSEPHREGTKLEQLSEVRAYLEGLRSQQEAERESVLRAVQADLDAIEAKYAQRLQDATQAMTELEAEVKAEALHQGKSLRLGGVQVVFYRGRVTWDSRGLEQYAEQNPEVQQFRKVGEPSVSIRYRTD
jgi:uncharacterized protein YifE (UPF0438 family)